MKRYSEHESDEQNENLKGTFVSVMMIGGFIFVLWIAMFLLYWNRL